MEKLQKASDYTKKAKYIIFNNEWEVIKPIGEGATGKVYLVRNMNDENKKAALKIIKTEYLK